MNVPLACKRIDDKSKEDLSHESPDAVLPDAVLAGAAPLLIIGAMAGG